MLLPIIMICVCALLGGDADFSEVVGQTQKSKNKDKEELAQITANEFVNVKDIRGELPLYP